MRYAKGSHVRRGIIYVIRPSLLNTLDIPWTGIQNSGITGQTIIVIRAKRLFNFKKNHP